MGRGRIISWPPQFFRVWPFWVSANFSSVTLSVSANVWLVTLSVSRQYRGGNPLEGVLGVLTGERKVKCVTLLDEKKGHTLRDTSRNTLAASVHLVSCGVLLQLSLIVRARFQFVFTSRIGHRYHHTDVPLQQDSPLDSVCRTRSAHSRRTCKMFAWLRASFGRLLPSESPRTISNPHSRTRGRKNISMNIDSTNTWIEQRRL